MKRPIALSLAALMLFLLMSGCAKQEDPAQTTSQASSVSAEETSSAETEDPKTEPEEPDVCPLEDGVYTADFDTDNSMFRANEACDGKGTLTVENGKMTIHVSLISKSIVNLFPGLAEDAQKEGAALLEPTVDPVTYSDGWSDEVFGFDIPVPALDEEFDVALIGKKGKWYDHKVSVSNPEPFVERGKTAAELSLADGLYTAEVQFAGGSGKAYVLSPASISVSGGEAVATIVWSSQHYDYMLVDDVKYDALSTENGSTFEIPVRAFDEDLPVIGDTTAMGTPHEIAYTLNFVSESLSLAEGAQ